MESIKINNAMYIGANDRKALVDLEIPKHFNEKIILFAHGFMGFKDWGCWNLMQAYFVKQGFGFCKYNVSHNGTTIDKPKDFVDLEAFSKNNYSNELNDLHAAIKFIEEKIEGEYQLILLGHSRGGGIVILGANQPKVVKIITLAAISSIEERFPNEEKLLEWKEKGFYTVRNNRTQQDLPISFLQYEDFQMNKKKLNIQLACEKLDKPVLIIHGNKDESVSINEGLKLSDWLSVPLTIIDGANHTFGASHPCTANQLPNHLLISLEKIIDFIHD